MTSKDYPKKENNKELLEIAAEQFARLFWKQWFYKKGSKESISKNLRSLKSKVRLEKNLKSTEIS